MPKIRTYTNQTLEDEIAWAKAKGLAELEYLKELLEEAKRRGLHLKK